MMERTETEETCQKAYGEFTVTCSCGSTHVEWENTLGNPQAPIVGAGFWCRDCGLYETMVEG